jgi:hypothetical protein
VYVLRTRAGQYMYCTYRVRRYKAHTVLVVQATVDERGRVCSMALYLYSTCKVHVQYEVRNYRIIRISPHHSNEWDEDIIFISRVFVHLGRYHLEMQRTLPICGAS